MRTRLIQQRDIGKGMVGIFASPHRNIATSKFAPLLATFSTSDFLSCLTYEFAGCGKARHHQSALLAVCQNVGVHKVDRIANSLQVGEVFIFNAETNCAFAEFFFERIDQFN